MSIAFYQVIDNLPTDGVTIRALRALDFVAPGHWENITGFQNLIQYVTGESDPQMVQAIWQRAMELYNDPAEGYQRALWMYQTVDRTDNALSNLALANAIGEKVNFLHFLTRVTPKADTMQTIDLTVKLVVELVAFCYVNGLPGDSIGDFVAALGAYERESLIRMGGLICFDGLLPLGPDFVQLVMNKLQGLSAGELEQNQTFSAVRQMIPGGDSYGQLGFLQQAFGNVSGWLQGFVNDRGLTPQAVAQNLGAYIVGADGALDIVAAMLDKTTDYFSHTGAQSLGRSLVERAVNEI